jgi:hypothetical protein
MTAIKRTFLLSGVVLAGMLISASAQVSFTHLKSIDLSSYFPANGQQGDLASDVAFDGANLYIAGMSTADTPDPVPVGVLKISNVLSLDASAWSYTPLITLTQAGRSCCSYIVYRDGFLYLGTGLGDTSNDQARTGIRKFNAQTGAQVTEWNISGVVTPGLLDGSSRAECIEIDPGYQGTSATLAVLAQGRDLIFRRVLATGRGFAARFVCRPLRDCVNGTGVTTGMRDITFSPEGDVYLRVDNSIFYGQRTGANTVADNRACRIFDFDSDDPSQVLINIHYLRTSAGNFLVYNRRTGDANNRLNKVFIASGSGATWTPYVELTGDEPLPNGSTPSAYGFDIFNFTSGVGPDPSKGDVNLDGVVDDADLLAVLFAFGSSNAATDVNSDGVVDDADLLTVLFNFGSRPQAQYLFIVHSSIDTDRLDIYRVD